LIAANSFSTLSFNDTFESFDNSSSIISRITLRNLDSSSLMGWIDSFKSPYPDAFHLPLASFGSPKPGASTVYPKSLTPN
jgi:hypothetical protein